jgi:hypothetical protein
MSRLRHPIRQLKEPFGKAGLTVAILALVLALVGGAYAAGGLTKSQEKQVTKIAKKYAGKPGAAGAPGAAGTNGTNGKDGTNGTSGTNGGSAEATSFTGTKTVGSVKCENGGAVVKSANPETAVCNGKNGTTGFTEFLPSGKTEKGAFGATAAGGEVLGILEGVIAPVSFNIPLEVAPTPHIVTIAEGETTECPGGVKAPEATAGSLCIFLAQEENLQGANVLPPWGEIANLGTSGPEGALVIGSHNGAPGSTTISGSWAVTAE